MSLTRTLVITGGTTGIGAAIVKQCASEGYQIVFNGTRSLEKVDSTLQKLPNAVYVSGDAGEQQTAIELRKQTGGKFGGNLGQLLVVANAGIEVADTDSEGVERMKRINVDGMRYLFNAFRDFLAVAPKREGETKEANNGLFVALGSIVGTLNIVLPGNKEYHATKVEIEKLVDGATTLFPPVPAITLSPGAIKTPMTESSPVYGILLRLAAMAAVKDADLKATLEKLNGANPLGSTPAEIFISLLGSPLETAPVAKVLKIVLQKDPEMKGERSLLLAAKAAQDEALKSRMAEILKDADILISPETVAQTLLQEFQERRIPNGGVLRAWQAGSAHPAPIARLFSAFV